MCVGGLTGCLIREANFTKAITYIRCRTLPQKDEGLKNRQGRHSRALPANAICSRACLVQRERETSVYTNYEEMELTCHASALMAGVKKCEIPIESDRKDLVDHMNELS